MKKEWSMREKRPVFLIAIVLAILMMLPIAGSNPVYAAASKVPSKVSITSVKADASDKVTVKWQKASNATEYRIYYRPSTTTKWTKVASVNSSSTSYTHTSSTKYKLDAGKKYYYTVRAYNKNTKKSGSYDKTGKAVTMPAVPAKVTTSSVTATANDKVSVTWKAAKNVTEYRVYYRPSTTTKWTKIAAVKSGTTSYVHTSSTKYPLTAGKTYYYTVRGYSSKAKKSGSYNKTGLAVTMPATPAKVTVNSAKATASNKVTVSWKEAAHSTDYRVYYKEKGASSWTKIKTVKSGTTSYTHTSSTKFPLKEGKTYYYTVRGYNSVSKKSGSYNKTGKSVTIPVKTVATPTPKPTATPTPKPTQTPNKDYFDYENATPEQMVKEVFRLTNIEREKAGVQPLIYDEGYQKVAMLRAKELSVLMSHTRPNGEDSPTADFDCDVASSSGENIAGGQCSPKRVVESWMNSLGHRAQLLDRENIYIGIGYYYDETSPYKYNWVQTFSEQKSSVRGYIIFEAEGGTFNLSESTMYYNKITNNGNNIVYTFPAGKDILLQDVPIPIREGYTFAGWKSKYGETNRVNACTSVSKNEIFYAQWTKIE